MLAVALLFAGTILRDILRYGVDVPFWDQWDFVAALRRSSSGETSWLRTLFLSGAEHQLGLQIVWSVLVWNLTQMNMVASMVLNWTFAFGFCILGTWITARALPPRSVIPWMVLAAASFFIFNPAAYQVWLWGLPLVHLLVPLLMFAGFACAQTRASDGTKIVVSAICAFFASFLLGSGLLLWFLFPAVLIYYVKPTALKTERLAVLVYGALCGACLMIYGFGALQGESPAPTSGAGGLGAIAQFFAAYTGNVVSLSAETQPVLWAQLVGSAFIMCFATLAILAFRGFRRRSEWPVITIWGCLGSYSIASGLMVALGRHGYGLAYAVESSRYVLASAFLPISVVVLAFVLIHAYSDELPSSIRLYSGTLCMTLIVLMAGVALRFLQWPRADAMMANSRASQTAGKVAVASSGVLGMPQWRNIHPNDDRDSFLRSVRFLSGRNWLRPAVWNEAFFRDLASPRRKPEPAYGYVDKFTMEGGKLQLGGWAYLPDRKLRADAVIVSARDGATARVLAVVFTSAPRRDVYESIHELEALSTGWAAEVIAAPGEVLLCFAYDAVTGQAHLLSGVGPDALMAPADGARVELKGGWTMDGYHADAGRPPGNGLAFGSWAGADANRGTLRLGPFRLDAQGGISIPLVTGPSNQGLAVFIRDEATKEILAELAPPPIRLTWWEWEPRLRSERARTVEIIAEDNGAGWGQWQALAWPQVQKKGREPVAGSRR